MGKPSSQQVDREATAAYSASQPLFDALRNGCNTLAAQASYLNAARDDVQNLHINVANGEEKDLTKQQYRIVKAWRSATECYTAIFEQLAKVTAADPSVGKESSAGHDDFQAMFKSAKKARKVATEFPIIEIDLDTDGDVPDATPIYNNSSSVNANGKRSHDDVDMSPNKSLEPPSKAAKTDDNPFGPMHPSRAALALGVVANPKTPDGKQRPRTKAEKYVRMAEKRAAKRIAREMKKRTDAGLDPSAVQYEDVSAEVANRLLRKRDKREAKKKAAKDAKAARTELKRKRNEANWAANPPKQREQSSPDGETASKEKPARKKKRKNAWNEGGRNQK